MSDIVLEPRHPVAANVDRMESASRPLLSRWALIFLVAAVALINGVFYLRIVPPWQHYDEPTHFEYVWLYAQLERRPEQVDVDLAMRRELAATMVTENFYNDVPYPDLLEDSDMGPGIGLLELAHPPLYYFLVSLPLRLVKAIDLTSQLYIARSVSLVLFVLIVLASAGLIAELTTRGHPLRWAVPLVVALFPPFANQMTAVNNDVGATLIVTLFLWASVRLIMRGLTVPTLLALFTIALLAPFVKTVAALTLLLLPLVIIVALWKAMDWSWRWLWPGFAVAILLPTLLIFQWDDAGYWYRSWGTSQSGGGRVATADAPWGDYALRATWQPKTRQQFLNPIAPDRAEALRGQTVTIGGWFWAAQPIEALSAMLIVSPQGTTAMQGEPAPAALTTTPTYLARTVQLADEAGRVHYGFVTRARDESPIVDLYLDGAFLVEGAIPTDQPPRIEGADVVMADGSRLPNLLRNGSAEQRGPRLRPWLAEPLARYSPNFGVMSLFDLQRTVPIMAGYVLPSVLADFVQAFGWGHVRLPAWIVIASRLLMALSLFGLSRWLFARRGPSRSEPALFLLAMAVTLVLLSAAAWSLPYTQFGRVLLPSGRYLFPVVVPFAILFTGGYWALFPRRWRSAALLLLLLLFIGYSAFSLQTIQSYYAAVASGS
ncbi:MAG: hypothetical protein KDD73_11185 [Anaerolineales bacterium]|nr:hypothetical protein [Anaerolineales bacterium]MCB9127367.1 hypothetical protein [Ardenticatenales bacterium]MCB9172702.1 hypothetical protein [Ardenticatenales bacterium]